MTARPPTTTDRYPPITDRRRALRGFGVAPILYLLGLVGVGAGILFSSYSQTIRTNIAISNSLATKNDLNAAATTLAATSQLGTDDATILCPPSGSYPSANCAVTANNPARMTNLANVNNTDVHLPTNYMTATSSGSPVEVGVFKAGAGVKQLDAWGHYYIYCRWESSANSTNPAFKLITAGSDGILQTNCGATTASGDDAITAVGAAEAVNRSSVWQIGSDGSATYGNTGQKVSVDVNGNMSVPGDLSLGGDFSSANGSITLQNGSITLDNGSLIAASVITGPLTATTGTFSESISTNGGALSTGSGGTISAVSGAFTVTAGGALKAASGAFTVDQTGSLAIGTNLFTVDGATGALTAKGSASLGSTLTVTGTTKLATTVGTGGVSTPMFTLGKPMGTIYPFEVDQYGSVTASNFNGSFNGNLSGSVSGGTVTASSITSSGTLTVNGALTGANANFSGTVTAANFSGTFTGNIDLGSGGTITGIIPIANGGTGASTASQALENLGVTSGAYLNTSLLKANLINGTVIKDQTLTSAKLTTVVSAGTYDRVEVDSAGRVIAGYTEPGTSDGINDGNGQAIGLGTTSGGMITFTIGSTIKNNMTTYGTMLGTSSVAVNQLDVYGNAAIGTGYAGVKSAPTNGLIVEGSTTIGTSIPVVGAALTVNGQISATNFVGDGSGLTGIGTGAITGTLGVTHGGTGTSTQFTPGSIVFAGTNGVYSQDNGSFFYDYANKRFGIGTSIPVVSADFSRNADALALPSGPTGNRPSGGSLLNGEIRYNTSLSSLEAYVAGSWVNLLTTSGSGSSIPAAGSTGYVQFNTDGVLNADSGFFWDNTNKRLGLGTTSPTNTLTVNGTAAFQLGTDISTTGVQNDVAFGATSNVRYTGSSTATFNGLTAGSNGQILYLHNASSSILTLANQSSADTTAANRIITGTGANMQVAANSSVTLQYDSAALRWRVVGGSGSGIPAGTTGQVQYNSGSNTFAANASFTWDITNSRLGIGTDTPAYPLQVVGKFGGDVLHLIGQAGGTGASTAPSSGSDGYVQFASGNSLSGSANFFWNNASARLGIGTSVPAYTLDVNGSVRAFSASALPSLISWSTNTTYPATVLLKSEDGTNYLSSGNTVGNVEFADAAGTGVSARIKIVASAVHSSTSTPGDITFATTSTGTNAPVERMRIDNAGNVAIGTTVASYALHVNGTIFGTGAAGAMSDERHKHNIHALPTALDAIMALKPVTFEWNKPADSGMQGIQTGFIAQQVEKVLPLSILTADNVERTKSIKFNEIVAFLTRALQELKALFDRDHATLTALQKTVEQDRLEIERLSAENRKLIERLDALEAKQSEGAK